jgi:RNA polymerase sigma-70 factor (ECF subfamily)
MFPVATPLSVTEFTTFSTDEASAAHARSDPCDFDGLVSRYYVSLYRFALSLTRHESDACDLTQQTFYAWARKGYQLLDRSKVKTWLFTTLHREFLQGRRRASRFTSVELSEVENELPPVTPTLSAGVDCRTMLDALARLDPVFQAPVALFYLEDYTYLEIGRILEVPLGTVKSRISRGLRQLQHLLIADAAKN